MFQLKLFGGVSLEGPNGPLTGRAVQRRRLAVLALLAGSRRGMSRDKLVAYLWPDADSERGRHLLSDSVYRINQAVGGTAVAAKGDDLRLDGQIIDCDVASFSDAIEAGDWQRAVTAYAGPFLDGFFLSEAEEFERWVDGERDRLGREYMRALDVLARDATARGDAGLAVDCWRRMVGHDPYSSRSALGLMRALEAAGERAAALRHARAYDALVQKDIGVPADISVLAYEEELRQKIDTTRTAPAAAVTLPGHEVPSVTPEMPEERTSTALPARARRLRSARPVVAGVAGLCALLILATLAVRQNAATRAPSADPATIAVLPFENLGADQDQTYFSEGMTEELINRLAQVPGLRVASRTSSYASRDRGDDVRAIGRRLGVANVLEGSVRRAGDRLRVTAQLVSVNDGYHLWSQEYDRELKSVFAIQDDIARSIVEKLQGRLLPAVVDSTPISPAEMQAYNLYLKGRYAWHRRSEHGLREAVRNFEEAVKLSPRLAQAWAGLGDAYAVLGFYDYLPAQTAFPKAKSAALHAIELDSRRAPPYATLGYVALYNEWKWSDAETAFRQAIALSPTYSTAHQWYANYLTAMGRFPEAVRAMQRARELDPLSLIANAALGWVHYYAGDYHAAIEQCRRTLELNPNFELAHYWSGLAWDALGRHAEAAAAFERGVAQSKGSPIMLAALARSLILGGRAEEAAVITAKLEQGGANGYVPSYDVAKIYVARGDTARALEWLERAYGERSHSLVFLLVDPQLASVRNEPAFQRLVHKVGLRS